MSMYIRLKETAPWPNVKIRGGYYLQKRKWKEVDSLEPYHLVERYLEIKDQENIEDKPIESSINYSKKKKPELVALAVEKLNMKKSEAQSFKKAELIEKLGG